MKFSLSTIALFGLVSFGIMYAADETADAMELAIRKSDPAVLRGLLIPGFDLTNQRKTELLALAKRVTNETFMNLNRASITDGWRFLKGVAKCALATCCGIAAYGLFMKELRFVQPAGVAAEVSISYPAEDNSSRTIVSSGGTEQLTDQQRAMRYLMSRVPSQQDGGQAAAASSISAEPLMISRILFPAASWGEKVANGMSAGLVFYLGYLGVSDIRGSIGGKARYKHHQRALAVEAIIQRIPACPGPDCPKSTAQLHAQTSQAQQAVETYIDIDQVD